MARGRDAGTGAAGATLRGHGRGVWALAVCGDRVEGRDGQKVGGGGGQEGGGVGVAAGGGGARGGGGRAASALPGGAREAGGRVGRGRGAGAGPGAGARAHGAAPGGPGPGPLPPGDGVGGVGRRGQGGGGRVGAGLRARGPRPRSRRPRPRSRRAGWLGEAAGLRCLRSPYASSAETSPPGVAAAGSAPGGRGGGARLARGPGAFAPTPCPITPLSPCPLRFIKPDSRYQAAPAVRAHRPESLGGRRPGTGPGTGHPPQRPRDRRIVVTVRRRPARTGSDQTRREHSKRPQPLRDGESESVSPDASAGLRAAIADAPDRPNRSDSALRRLRRRRPPPPSP